MDFVHRSSVLLFVPGLADGSDYLLALAMQEFFPHDSRPRVICGGLGGSGKGFSPRT
jgi:hypothetical protein